MSEEFVLEIVVDVFLDDDVFRVVLWVAGVSACCDRMMKQGRSGVR